jgi:hypothetical protein
MAQNVDQASLLAILRGPLPTLPLLLFMLVLSNSPQGVVSGILALVVIFFLPGYLVLTVLGKHLPGGVRIILGPIIGIVSITAAYDILVRAARATCFFSTTVLVPRCPFWPTCSSF